MIAVMDHPQAAPNTLCSLKHIRLCDGMTPAEVQDMKRITRLQEVKKHQPLYLSGDPSRNVYLLEHGRITLTKIGAGGKVVTVEVLEPGEVFGELEALEGVPRETAAEALDDTMLCVIHGKDFVNYLSTHPNISMKLTRVIGLRLRRAQSRIEDLVCRNVPARLAQLLFELRRREESRGIGTTLTHQEMANLIGCSRETVSNALGRFRNYGLIHIKGRTVTIVDEKGLSTLLSYDGSTHLRCTDRHEDQWQTGVQSARGRHLDQRHDPRAMWRDTLRGADTLRS